MATLIEQAPEDARKVAEHIRGLEPTELPFWKDLDALSTHTFVEAIEVDPEGIVVSGDGRFEGVFDVYVVLQYGRDGDEGFSTSDSFLASFDGHFEDGDVVIDRASVDTSSFYE